MLALMGARGEIGLFGLVLAVLLGGTAPAAEISLAKGACPSPAGESVTVAEAVEANTVRLGDGRIVRLAGVETPRPPLAEAGPWVLGDAARDALQRLAVGQPATLRPAATRPDRYGRLPGDLVLPGGRSLAEALVAAGLARVRVVLGETACFPGLLAAERRARAAGLGLWVGPDYAVRRVGSRADEASLEARSGLYELVEGRILSVGHGTRVIFLDFGRDYRRDFTVMLPSAVAGRLAMPVETLAKRRVRVRGIIEENNGPAMRVEDPAAIEILDEGDGAAGQG
jgi:endonuclease YncB( thermonuclease family)